MPRQNFIHDLHEASSPGRYPQLANLRPGEDDGTIACTFIPASDSERPVDVQLFVPGTYCLRLAVQFHLLTRVQDLTSYPEDHEYLVYTTSDDVPVAVTACLAKI